MYKMFNLKLVIMKKLTYVLILMTAMVFMNTSCTKPTDDPVLQTLEQQYPDWVNLTWASTTKDNVDVQYPKISYLITDNVVTETSIDESGTYVGTYEKITLTSTIITFIHVNQYGVTIQEQAYIYANPDVNTVTLKPTPNNPLNIKYTLHIVK
jgi:hypothetical protein